MWLDRAWQVAAYSAEVDRTLLARRLLDRPVVLYRTASGRAVALEDRCAHRQVPLSLGTLEGDDVRCGYHGMCYRPDGVCRDVPGQGTIPARAHVASYPLVERDGLIWICLDPEPRTAAPPDPAWLRDPLWTTVRGYHHIAADAMLVIDNLLDLSHETFVHPDTIGNAAIATFPVTAEIVDGAFVRVHRDMPDITPPPLYVEHRGGRPQNIDRWHTTTYVPPGYLFIENGSRPAGSTDARDVQQRRIINFVTPETATTSHYFWCVARNYALEDADLSASLLAAVQFTFDQDKVLLEAQQRSLDGPDPLTNVTIKVDAGPILGRRLLTMLAQSTPASTMPAPPPASVA
jgi:phenylpropionate dioxygenase-like ring-hydroxylating dioxygenase large terminal subunit